MAGIKSLALRGIRSFGPEDNDEQRISFDKPLTLILGQNGCGKTTIIECLRYAVSGQMPPGSRNECFVHDAKINRSAEVLGQVKLKIVNAKDKLLEISRSMRVTMVQKKKAKFQTLDSFLSVVDEDGSAKDISSRCADLDLLVQEELGVSKAIINSVIFCHQEDSSWPLEEGKKVKERFDEIFDADKYSDCFDRIKKLRKEYALNIKMLNLEVANLTEKKEALDKKKLETVDTETKISEAEIKVAEIASELGPITEKIKAIELLQKELVAFETKKDKMKTRMDHCKTQEEELTKNIKKMFEGTTPELQENITNYAGTLKTKKKELEDSQRKVVSYTKEEEKLKNDLSSNEVKFNKLMLLESQHQERIEKKNKMIVASAQLAELPDIKEITCKEDADKTEELIVARINTLHQELDGLKAQADAEENKVQAIVNESRDGLSRHKQKIDGKEADIVKARKEIAKLQKEINQATESKQKLEKMEEKFKAAEEEYENFQKSLDVEESQKEIAEDEKMMEQHEREQDEINETISKLQKQTAKLKERDMKEEQLKSKEKAFGVLKNKHRSAITELLETMPEKDFAVSINKLECETRNEVDGMKKKRKAQQLEVTKLETERKHVRELLNERRSELTSAEDQMYQACGSQTYEATLTKTTAAVEKLQEDRNLLQSTIFIFGKYQTQLKESSCCPLCNRGFEHNSEVTDLLSDMATKVMNVPAKLEQVTADLQKESAKKDDLLSLKSLNEKIAKLKETDIPLLEKRLSEADKKILDINASLEEIAKNITAPEQKLATAKQIQGDMPLLDRYIKEIDVATKDFEAIKAECVDFTSDVTLEDAQAKQSDLKTKISTLRARVKTARAKLNAHNKKLQTMLNAKNKLKEEMLNLQKKVQQIVNLQETLKQHEEDIVKFENELKELKEGVAPLEEELKEKEMEKKVVVSKNRSEIEAKRFFISKIENSYEKVKAIQREIKQHEERNIQREMDKIKEFNERITDKKAQIVKEREELVVKIDNLKEEWTQQEIFKRDLEDNLKLRKAQSEAETCEKEIKDIEEKLSGMNTESIPEKEGLIAKQTQLFRDKTSMECDLKSFKDRLKYLKQELQHAIKQNTEKKYTEKFYDLHVTQALDKDLRDYCVALEKCLMEFHREKMENINLIIRELWRKIYRGNDIDYIEIKTESLMTTESDRRKYDYRVVQCKNGVEIDMRGRCSAGQKVLACLIIRLALAETFSSRFGILALDEPTTNLDEENVRSLCTALGEIVQERMKQKNFMFIIITHDKEFIDSLGNIDKVSHYYEVSRNEEGKSRIKKVRFV